jgi:hypothetical protein
MKSLRFYLLIFGAILIILYGIVETVFTVYAAGVWNIRSFESSQRSEKTV